MSTRGIWSGYGGGPDIHQFKLTLDVRIFIQEGFAYIWPCELSKRTWKPRKEKFNFIQNFSPEMDRKNAKNLEAPKLQGLSKFGTEKRLSCLNCQKYITWCDQEACVGRLKRPLVNLGELGVSHIANFELVLHYFQPCKGHWSGAGYELADDVHHHQWQSWQKEVSKFPTDRGNARFH